MFKDTWDTSTARGKKRVTALLGILRRAKHKEDVRIMALKDKRLKGIRYFATHQFIRRQSEQSPPTEIGRLWSNLSEKPNRIIELFPNSDERARLIEDLKHISIAELRKKYKQLNNFRTPEIRNIIDTLGIKRGHISRPGTPTALSATNWWKTGLATKELQQKFLERWRSDYRLPGNKRRDLLDEFKKIGCPNETGLQEAARALGEKRTRYDIVKAIMKGPDVLKAIDGRTAELIRTGALSRMGLERLYALIRKEYAKDLAKAKNDFSPADFKKTVSKLIWTDGKKGNLTAFTEAIKAGATAEEYHRYHKKIPLEFAKEKETELRGLTNKTHPISFAPATVRGIGRFAGEGLLDVEDFEFPNSSSKAPYLITPRNKSWKTMELNGANIGLKYNPIIDENPVRRAFSYAEHERHDAIFLTNTIHIDTKKAAGPSRVLRAIFSGMNVNPDLFPESYREKVLEIIRDKPTDKVIYQKPAEALNNNMSGWRKITVRPNGTPEYSGKVYIMFGLPEHMLVAAIAYWHVHYITAVEKNRLKSLLGPAYRELTDSENRILSMQAQLTELHEKLAEEKNRKKRKTLNEDIKSLEADIAALLIDHEELAKDVAALQDEEERTIISNVIDEHWNFYYKKALSYVAKRFKESIPNCEIIGMATTHVEMTGKKLAFHFPGHERVTDGDLSSSANSYGPKVNREEMPDVTVIVSPYGLDNRGTAREVDYNGNRGSALMVTAPICVDEGYLRPRLKHSFLGGNHPLERKLKNELSSPGVLVLHHMNGVIVPENVSIANLGVYSGKEKKVALTKKTLNEKYIYIMVDTDQHWGGRSKMFIWDPFIERYLGMSDAAFELMRRAGYCKNGKLPPLHIYTANDDWVQGQHFAAHQQPHRHELPYFQIQAKINDLTHQIEDSKSATERKRLLALYRLFVLYQFRVRGVDATGNQMEMVLKEHLEPNLDIFDGLLQRAHKGQITMRGEADMLGLVACSKDLGIINDGTGNHFVKTVDGHVSEGPIYANYTRQLLARLPYWQDKDAFLLRNVRAPVDGKEFKGYGVGGAAGGYEYGFEFRDTPSAKGVDWGDTLRMWARNDLRRGNPSRILNGRKIIKTTGDKHFLGWLFTEHADYFMGPASTETDLYGELGFPPNNTGTLIVGIPAEHPDAAPVLIRPLLFDQLKRLIEDESRPTLNWEEFLPNPL